ncbi:dapper homolog 1 [Osmerus eperlanus]|uniref:dapper homolog 1 n=1 Tax=Osmerus eperlanus TaxID=29151 RepID=UPI002E0F9181
MDTMKQTGAASEMLPSNDCSQMRDIRRECDARSRERVEGEMDRLRIRERLEATFAGLGELEYLRQRQELLVRNVLNHPEDAIPIGDKACVTREENYLNSEEKLLEENILLLRKQLNCLRRRDAGLITQLQELDRQISDLRLDTEVSHDPGETDSRPSSGFYELSDGASGSLSNSSNSVFSECLSSCRSSTCLCSPLDTSLCSSDGRLRSADELGSCAECEGPCDEQSSGTVRRSLSAPYPPSLDGSSDGPSKYHCDLVARNGSDIYRYPSPLHAVAVQSPMFISSLAPPGREDGGQGRGGGGGGVGGGGGGVESETSVDAQKADRENVLVPQSTSWPASQHTPSHRRLDSYIYSLLQRRALPLRTSRPRTSISTDPSKSILRQASLCVRQGGAGQASAGQLQGQVLGNGTLRTSEVKHSWPPCLQTGTAGTTDPPSASPQRQWSGEGVGLTVQQESALSQSHTQNGYTVPSNQPQTGYTVPSNQPQTGYTVPSNQPQTGYTVPNSEIHTVPNTNILLKKKNSFSANKGPSSATMLAPPLPPKDYPDLGSPKANSSPKEGKLQYHPGSVENTLTRTAQTATPKNSPKPLPPGQSGKDDRPSLELVSLGSSSQSQDEGSHMVSAQYIPAQRQAIKLRKGGGKNIKVVKVKNAALKPRVMISAGQGEPETLTTKEKQQPRSGNRKSRLPEDVSSHVHKISKRGASSRAKRIPASIPEGRVLEKHVSTVVSTGRSHAAVSRHHGHHGHHHHGHREAVVAKPKYKRSDYRRLRAITEAPYEEALRRAQRRQRRDLIGHVSTATTTMYLPSNLQFTSPYAYVGSDSEYSAECASLFHSTVMDTSEDERSNYTTNCFGDSESSVSEVELAGESSSSSDSEESGGALNWPQFGQAAAGSGPHDMTPAQAKAFVKIKASHNLKKKILRFRSGSLKLMTTV